jgi:hypothetical protein
MASETGNNNNTVVATAGGGNMLGFFWTNETALCITLVLGVFFLAANLILFVAIYRRRMACGRRRNGDKRHDDDGDTSLQVRTHTPTHAQTKSIFFSYSLDKYPGIISFLTLRLTRVIMSIHLHTSVLDVILSLSDILLSLLVFSHVFYVRPGVCLFSRKRLGCGRDTFARLWIRRQC